jgi:hypothetical protein
LTARNRLEKHKFSTQNGHRVLNNIYLIVFQLGKRLESQPEKIILQGIYVHCGNSYAADSVEGVEKVEDFKKKIF